MKVVLDTNVLLSAFAAHGLCEAVFQVCLSKHEIVLSRHILKEVTRNLRAKLKVSARDTDAIVTLLRKNATLVKPAHIAPGLCDDQDDLPVLGTVLAAKADCFVTGDQHLLELKEFHAIPILSPRAFHDRLM